MLTCLFGKPEAVEAIALGEHGLDLPMSEACAAWAPLPEPLILVDDDELFRVSRHRRENEIWTWIGLYRPAKAIGSTRPGGFYGAAVLCLDEEVDGAKAISYLRRAANLVQRGVMVGDAFVNKLAPFQPTIDFKGVKRELARERLPGSSGLQADSEQEAYIHITGVLNDKAIGALIGDAQSDKRFTPESAIYASRSFQLAAAAERSTATTRIERVYTPAAYYDREPPKQKAAPEPAAAPPAPSRTLRTTGYAGTEAPPLSRDTIEWLIETAVKEAVEKQLKEQLPGQLRQLLPVIKRRRWLEAGAVTGTMLLLFIAAVLLALPYAGRTPAPPAKGPQELTNAAEPANTDTADVTLAIQSYFQALETGSFVTAKSAWETGRSQLNAETLPAEFPAKFSAYKLTDVTGVKIDENQATATATVEVQLKAGGSLIAKPVVTLTRRPAGAGWLIIGMTFAGADRAADPERL